MTEEGARNWAQRGGLSAPPLVTLALPGNAWREYRKADVLSVWLVRDIGEGAADAIIPARGKPIGAILESRMGDVQAGTLVALTAEESSALQCEWEAVRGEGGRRPEIALEIDREREARDAKRAGMKVFTVERAPYVPRPAGGRKYPPHFRPRPPKSVPKDDGAPLGGKAISGPASAAWWPTAEKPADLGDAKRLPNPWK